ncbi:MAG: sialate O-acetylesterase [Planctomycetota bacterium]
MYRFLVLLASSVVTAATYAGETVDLLLLAGQSNMVGQAVATSTTPGVSPADTRIAYYYEVTNTGGSFADDSNQTFGTLTPWRRSSSDRRFGPEFSLGRDLDAAGLNPALVKVAVGGANIARWQPGAIDYYAFRTAVLDAVGEINAAGNTVNPLGVAWLQGESDVINTARADAYAANLSAMITGLRLDLDAALPGVGFAEMNAFLIEPADWKNGSNPGIATAANIAKVNQALADFAAADPNAWFLPTDDFTQFGDGLIHFGPADQITLGSRLADAVLAAAVPEPASLALPVSACVPLIFCRSGGARKLPTTPHCNQTR